jgi:trimeric autotransporter adhesin
VQLGYPSSVAADNSGNVIIADSNRIRRVSPDGMITTVAGNGTKEFSGDGGPAVNAQLQDPAALVLDGAGNLFFGDSDGKRVRRVSANGVITTVAVARV